MTRALMVGMTDYSHQSIGDMLVDIDGWISSLNEVIGSLDKTIQTVEEIGYWSGVDFDFKAICGYSRKFFETSIEGLTEVKQGMNTEIAQYHVNVLKRMYSTAREVHQNLRNIWSEYENKEYGNPMFRKVEFIDQEIGNMTGDMFDLSNLAGRLEDFIGRRNLESMTKGTNVTNVFHAPVSGIQQNFDDSQGTQLIGSNTSSDSMNELNSILETIKGLLAEVPPKTTEVVYESISDLQECISQEVPPKRSKFIAFSAAVVGGLRQLFTVKGIANLDTVSNQIPQIVDNLEKTIHHIGSAL